MLEDTQQSERHPSWYDHVKHSWWVNTILIPLAISLICAYCAHWLR